MNPSIKFATSLHYAGVWVRVLLLHYVSVTTDCNQPVFLFCHLYGVYRSDHLSTTDPASLAEWISLVFTSSTFYTDTVPHLDRHTQLQNKHVTYRVRAENEVGWGHFCAAFTVSLVDKLCQGPTAASQRMKGDKFAMQQTKQLLLPHGVTVPSTAHKSSAENVASSTDEQSNKATSTTLTSKMKILSQSEVKDILHSNMLCAPAPRVTDFDTEEDVEEEAEHTELRSAPQSKKHQIRTGKGTQTGSSTSESSKVKEVTVSLNSDADRLKSVTMDTHSTLAGDSLENVNTEMQLWLARLADACPLDDHEDMWQTRKRIAATTALNDRSKKRKAKQEQDFLDDCHRSDDDDDNDEYNPYLDINNADTAVDFQHQLQLNTQKNQDTPHHSKHHVSSPSTSSAASLSPKLSSKTANPSAAIMDTVYSQSEKYLRNIMDTGGDICELDNVIQRLAMVRMNAKPSKSKSKKVEGGEKNLMSSSTENFQMMISSSLPPISDK